MARQRRSTGKVLSAEEAARLRKVREQFQTERPSLEELTESGRYTAPITQEENFALMQFAAAFKTLRQEKKMSLADVAKATGLDRSQISRIENAMNPNPTISTLELLAHALGRRVRIVLDEACSAAAG